MTDDPAVRKERVKAAAQIALAEAGCLHVTQLTPWMVEQLTVNGDGHVVGVDSSGQVRAGADGLMTAPELAAEAKARMPGLFAQFAET